MNSERTPPTQPSLVNGSSRGMQIRSIDAYRVIDQLGEGTFGGRDKETQELVAVKKVAIRDGQEGFPITLIREIKFLKELRHPNIVCLKEIAISPDPKSTSFYMIFELMENDLWTIMSTHWRTHRPSLAHLKCIMKQILEGVHYCHANGVLHRDIKASNILLNAKGEVKIADFGLARSFSLDAPKRFTPRMVTLWYRSPELLLGSENYTWEVDMWSVGTRGFICSCLMAELMTGRPLFPGHDELQMLNLIYGLCGTPYSQGWLSGMELPWYNLMKPKRENSSNFVSNHSKFFGSTPVPSELLELLSMLISLDPRKRVTAATALDHNFFWTAPLPSKPSDLAVPQNYLPKRFPEEFPLPSNAKRQKTIPVTEPSYCR